MKVNKLLFFPLFALITGLCDGQTLLVTEFSFPEELTDITKTGQLNYFDSNLGTLTGAYLELFGSATTAGSLRRTESGTADYNVKVDVDLFFTGGSGVAGIDSWIASQLIVFAETFPLENVGTTFKDFAALTNQQNVSLDLFAYLSGIQQPGGGSFNIDGETITAFTVTGGGGNTELSKTTTAGIGARITYTYTPFSVIPEPSQAISTLALCTFGLMLRRRAGKR